MSFPNVGDEVHVSITSHAISAFMDVHRTALVCFRCGESGHVRYQCLRHKVRLCSRWEAGVCEMGSACRFAHGTSELRTPWKPRCVRVVKQEGKLVCIGCNSTEHTFRKCPLHRDMAFV